MELLVIIFGLAAMASLLHALWPNTARTQVKYRKTAGVALTGFVLACLVFHFITVSGFIFSATITQNGTIDLGDGTKKEFEVLYPKKYVSVPKLNVSFTKGYVHIELVELRSDGFKFTANEVGYAISDGVLVDWEASGK